MEESAVTTALGLNSHNIEVDVDKEIECAEMPEPVFG
jgi:hypothetical protein